MASNFQIGATVDTLTPLDELDVPIEDPKSSYVPYARVVNTGSNGQRGVGSAMAVWDFALLSVEQRNMLKTFCTGASAQVFIQTKLNDDTFDIFQGEMLWISGSEDRWKAGVKKNLSFTFRALEEV